MRVILISTRILLPARSRTVQVRSAPCQPVCLQVKPGRVTPSNASGCSSTSIKHGALPGGPRPSWALPGIVSQSPAHGDDRLFALAALPGPAVRWVRAMGGADCRWCAPHEGHFRKANEQVTVLVLSNLCSLGAFWSHSADMCNLTGGHGSVWVASRLACVLIAVAMASAAAWASEPAGGTAEPLRITVTSRVLHPIDPRLFGQFMERPSWSGEIGPEAAVVPGTGRLRADAEQLIQQMRIPVLRFPGGTDADYLDWTDMIDNVPGREGPGRPVSRPRGNEVTNAFGYDEFLQLCQRLGSEAILVVNFRDGLLGGKPPAEAARHAAALVAYCNARADAKLPDGLDRWARLRAANGRREPYGARYVQIGNETWFFAKDVKELRPDNPDGYWADCIAAYVEAIRSVDPDIRILVDGHPLEVAAMVHKRLGGKIHAYALHRYAPWTIDAIRRGGDEPVDPGTVTPEDVWRCWTACPATDANGQAVLADGSLEQARRLGYRIAVTEWNWNGWWRLEGGRPPLESRLAKGLGAASFLHAICRNGDAVILATQSMLIGRGWDIAAIHVGRRGNAPPFMVPTGMVTALYSRHHGDRRLAVEMANAACYRQPYRMGGLRPQEKVAFVDVLATRSDRAVFVHLIHRRFTDARRVRIDLSAFAPAAEATLHVMTGRLRNRPAPGEPLASASVDQRTAKVAGGLLTFDLPPRSVVIAEVPLRR